MMNARIRKWAETGMQRWTGRRREVLALVLFAAGALFYLGAIGPERKRLDHAREQAAALELRRGPRTAAAASPVVAELGQFYARFSSESRFPDLLGRLFKTAAAHQLSLDEGEYRVTRPTEGKLVRFRMVFPLRGSYPQVRSFLSALAQDVPGVAIDNAQFERSDLGQPTVTVKLTLVLFLVRVP